MSTLAEIERAATELSPAEAEDLERRLHVLNEARRSHGKVFTASDAIRWWSNRSPLPAEDAEAFANDVESARAEANRPPPERRWE
jgi:hypothetical protein